MMRSDNAKSGMQQAPARSLYRAPDTYTHLRAHETYTNLVRRLLH